MSQKIPQKIAQNRILILGAGIFHVRTLEKLKEAGFFVIAVDKNKDAPGAKACDLFFPIDITDVESILACAIEQKIDGIMPLNEFGIPTHAHVAKKLGLLGLSPHQVVAVVDKVTMRQVWQQSHLSQPDFIGFTEKDELLTAAQTLDYPIVIKPSDSGGSGRGILIVESDEELETAYQFAKPHARNSKLILEKFIDGTEITVEGLCYENQHHILAWSDKEKPNLKTRVATSLNYPACFDSNVFEKVKQLLERAINSLELNNCATHTELIIDKQNQPHLIELGARGGGGHVFSSIVEAVSGINMPVELAKILTGQRPNLKPKWQKGACYRFFNPPQGQIVAINGLQEAQKIKGVLDIDMVKKVGDHIGLLINSQERAGYLVTTGKTREDACNLANHIEKNVIHIKIEKSLLNL